MEYHIRPIEISDGKGINELRRMPGVFENILGIPSERAKRNEEFIANLDVNQHQFVAVARLQDGQEVIIGSAGLTVYPNHRMRHSGAIGIMIHKDYQNQGIGSALLGRLIDVADNWLMLVRIELTVFVDNARAIHLYERFGFEKEGIKRLAAIRNGKYEDEYLMARINRSNYNLQS
ncbi:MAG TPA: GNAT family N-acetyltransferase [Desulfitobacterium dehalogenans]|uniref:GNAT family N-acetyltransferase n=1 Tax=Desulfitobacterium dehalogenans TaxID=36854 RepID=A0A7C6Z7M4_9FIRM|nr:GNAT family N-acetyltransferase [Desulfitobacterium dehalogenans]